MIRGNATPTMVPSRTIIERAAARTPSPIQRRLPWLAEGSVAVPGMPWAPVAGSVAVGAVAGLAVGGAVRGPDASGLDMTSSPWTKEAWWADRFPR